MRFNTALTMTPVFALTAIAATSSAHAEILTFSSALTGAAEAPPNASPATGFGQVDFDTTTHMMRVRAFFNGLLAPTTASHIHSATAVPGVGTAPVATQTPSFSGFPLGVTSGSFDNTYDMSLASSYNPNFITAHGGTPASAEAFLIQSLTDGTAYFNIHTSSFPGGEIRGFLQVPAPSAAAMLGVAGLATLRRRRR